MCLKLYWTLVLLSVPLISQEKTKTQICTRNLSGFSFLPSLADGPDLRQNLASSKSQRRDSSRKTKGCQLYPQTHVWSITLVSSLTAAFSTLYASSYYRSLIFHCLVPLNLSTYFGSIYCLTRFEYFRSPWRGWFSNRRYCPKFVNSILQVPPCTGPRWRRGCYMLVHEPCFTNGMFASSLPGCLAWYYGLEIFLNRYKDPIKMKSE